MSKGLKVSHWNVQRLLNKTDQLKETVRDLKTQSHVLGISETWLNDKYNDEFVKMPDYHHPPELKDRTQAVHGDLYIRI